MAVADIPNIDDAIRRFQESDHQRMQLLERVVHAFKDLSAAYHSLQDDYDNEKESRVQWQRRCRISEEEASKAKVNASDQVRKIHSQSDSNPFALALIDGDGAIFQEHMLAAKGAGGSDAAHALANEIKNTLKTKDDSAGHWAIMVQIFANFEGLSKRLASIGILNRPEDLYMFVREFNLSHPHFSFIDVGPGKERSDHKVRETFRLFVQNMHCKHIIFGPCHDNGYLPILESYKRDENVAPRLTLLQTTPAGAGFLSLGFDMISFPSVFRSVELPQRQVLLPRPSPPTAVSRPPPMANPASASSTTSSSISPFATPSSISAPGPSPRPTPTSISYAKAAPANGEWIDVSSSNQRAPPPRKYVLLNAQSQRIDELLRVDTISKGRLQERIKLSGSVCNNYHLLGKCELGDLCNHDHAPRLDKALQQALKARARTTPCRNGSSCLDVDCYLGHMCPVYPDCSLAYCKFEAKSLHGIDSTPRMKQYQDDEVVVLS